MLPHLAWFLFGYGDAPAASAATETTWCTIRDDISARLIAATPSVRPEYLFDHANKRYPIEMWAEATGASSTLFRRFQWRRELLDDPPWLDATTAERNETAILTVAYPVLPGMYGVTDYDEIERVMRRDAKQIRDLITSPSGYVGGLCATRVTVLRPDTIGTIWYQRFRVLTIYREVEALDA